MSAWVGIDVLAVRLGLIVAPSITGPIAILPYVLVGWLATEDR